MADDIETLMNRFYTDTATDGKLELIDELFAEACVEHEEFPGISSDREGTKQFFTMIREAFDGFGMDAQQILVDGDTGIARSTMRGTHSGEFMGVPASGNPIEVQVTDIVRFEDGKAIEHWGSTDAMALMQQIGAIPDGPPA